MPPSSSLLPRVLQAGAVAALVFAVAGIYLLDDPLVPPAVVVIGLFVASALANLLAAYLVRTTPGGARAWRTWPPPWVYVAYVALLVAVYAGAPTAESRMELGRQLLFLLVVLATSMASTAPRAAAGLVATHLAGVTLVFLQIPGPRSGVDQIGRLLYYHALDQWSGYPEIGLLLAMGASMAAAIALARRRPTVQVAAAALALVFTVAAAWIGSRSAVLTIGASVAWLMSAAALRWRSRLALAAALVLAVVVVWGVAIGPSPVERLERASASVSKETAIRGVGWQAAMTMVREHPWLGVGLGRYTAEYRARKMGTDPSHAYNLLLHVAAETGVIGLAAYLAIWLRVVWSSLRGAAQTLEGASAFAVHGALVAFFIRSQSEHFLANLWTSTRTLLLLATLFGLAEGMRRAVTARPSGSARTSPPVAPPAA